MIVDSMTHKEVYQELERDREGVTRWWRHTLASQRRRALKCTKFPMSIWFEHVSPRKVKYLFCTRIFDKRMKNILTGALAIRRTQDGLTFYTTWLDDQMLVNPIVLTPHMMKQYAARCGVNKTGIELARHYFTRNTHGKDSHNQQVVGRSVRYNGEEHQSCCVHEGVLLGQVYDGIYVARTFITYDMCTGLQQKEFDGCRKYILTDRELYEKASEIYSNPYR